MNRRDYGEKDRLNSTITTGIGPYLDKESQQRSSERSDFSRRNDLRRTSTSASRSSSSSSSSGSTNFKSEIQNRGKSFVPPIRISEGKSSNLNRFPNNRTNDFPNRYSPETNQFRSSSSSSSSNPYKSKQKLIQPVRRMEFLLHRLSLGSYFLTSTPPSFLFPCIHSFD